MIISKLEFATDVVLGRLWTAWLTVSQSIWKQTRRVGCFYRILCACIVYPDTGSFVQRTSYSLVHTQYLWQHSKFAVVFKQCLFFSVQKYTFFIEHDMFLIILHIIIFIFYSVLSIRIKHFRFVSQSTGHFICHIYHLLYFLYWQEPKNYLNLVVSKLRVLFHDAKIKVVNLVYLILI